MCSLTEMSTWSHPTSEVLGMPSCCGTLWDKKEIKQLGAPSSEPLAALGLGFQTSCLLGPCSSHKASLICAPYIYLLRSYNVGQSNDPYNPGGQEICPHRAWICMLWIQSTEQKLKPDYKFRGMVTRGVSASVHVPEFKHPETSDPPPLPPLPPRHYLHLHVVTGRNHSF